MNTLPYHTETEEDALLASGTSRTIKLVMAGLFALGILDGYQDYAAYDADKTPIVETQQK